MRSMLLGFAAVVALLMAACMPQAPGPLPAEELHKVRAVGQAFQEAFNAGDVNGVLATYAEDAAVLLPEGELLRAPDAIRQYYETSLALGGILTVSSVETYGEGSVAYDVGTYAYTYTDPIGTTHTGTGNYVTVLRKSVDGSWKVVADSRFVQPAAVGWVRVAASDSAAYPVWKDGRLRGHTTVELSQRSGTRSTYQVKDSKEVTLCDTAIVVAEYESVCLLCDPAARSIRRVQCPAQ